mmetsp:Transcript_29217/g.83934  ORF Transcript_29217/g.83934 Transcript_29217/m.83934 type:complete len:115 (-) Transcript_29217:463-807(-)
MKCNDWGAFYRHLAELGCWMSGGTADGKQHFAPEQARANMLSIGGTKNEVGISKAIAGMPEQEVCAAMDRPITWEEFQADIAKMKPSAAGNDEVTIAMVREASEPVQHEVHEIV